MQHDSRYAIHINILLGIFIPPFPGDEPYLVADLLDADALAGEDDAEIDLLAIEADAAACVNGGQN